MLINWLEVLTINKMVENEIKQEVKEQSENKMKVVEIEKVILSCGGTKESLEKSVKLLKKISGKKPSEKITKRRIPSFQIRPQMPVGCMVTLRGKEALKLLARLLAAIDNQLKAKQIVDNHFSFGIEEYINIPDEKYDREIGMEGFKVTIVFSRKGKRIARKKIKSGKIPKRQDVTKQEIIKFMEDNFKTEII